MGDVWGFGFIGCVGVLKNRGFSVGVSLLGNGLFWAVLLLGFGVFFLGCGSWGCEGFALGVTGFDAGSAVGAVLGASCGFTGGVLGGTGFTFCCGASGFLSFGVFGFSAGVGFGLGVSFLGVGGVAGFGSALGSGFGCSRGAGVTAGAG